jgi:hypothetical protein
MANTADGVSWDTASPADSALVSAEPVEVRGLRTGTGSRLAKEHVAPAAASVGGEHLAGSAKAYYTGVAPVNRPDGTALDNVVTPTGDKGRIWINGTTLSVWTGLAWVAINASATNIFAATLNETQVTGVQGGAFASGAFVTRALNTKVDPNGIITAFAANQFALGAGTFLIIATAPAMRVNGHKIKLRNITDGTDAAIGTTEFSGSAGDYAETRSRLEAIVTLAGAKTFEIQHRCESTSGLSNARGRASSLGATEVYTTVFIIKLA